jgi:crossover junction endodeoxyribonuclease RuvC
VRIFGIDPGSDCTGYGCVETDGSRHRIVVCGGIRTPASTSFPDKLLHIHRTLAALIGDTRPDCVAIESLFHAVNVRSALKLGHARGVAMLAAVEAGVPVMEYTPAAIKRAVVGYGRAEKHQVQHMVKLMLRLPAVPTPHDAADALAVAICHVHAHATSPARIASAMPARTKATSWRTYRPAFAPEALRQGKPPSAPAALRRGKPARS